MASRPQTFGDCIMKDVKGRSVYAKTHGQNELINTIANYDVTFAAGPAGTGKTFLSVVMAAKALQEGIYDKVILVRPAMEAGENLGFLPGGFEDKVGPYMRPLFDSLEAVLPRPKVNTPQEVYTSASGKKGKRKAPEPAQPLPQDSIGWGDKVEIAPLAYMRGRSLNRCFIILDEAQNATKAQMKMFLTRMGQGSKIVVSGDDRQCDLPYSDMSGFMHAFKLLEGQKGIGTVVLNESDIVRHELVKRIVKAYEDEGKDYRREGVLSNR